MADTAKLNMGIIDEVNKNSICMLIAILLLVSGCALNEDFQVGLEY